MIVRMCCALALVALVAGPAPLSAAPLAELISMRTDDKVLLHGLHYSPATASRSAVIHVPGGPGAFYSIQDVAPLAEALTRNGYHFFSVNLRTAGTNGMLYARFEDSQPDIAAMVRFAKEKGCDQIVFLAVSLSAARAFHYLSQTREPAVKAVVLAGAVSSPYLEAQLRWNPA